jgi:hypothetical protein
LAIRLTGKGRFSRISEDKRMIINWRGSAGATVRLESNK